ncbi:hypothetical protein AVEN_264044-1 [Araneus ventricosus]|uniref:Uncharacterized protein n=1 Tax=Araneus ventricosus TaxID=182803 RepID=A0A4Y2B4R6_ARAVE|nr:hypothetical protein AVEN_264044-1 [Araneus ventricosus]
MSDDEIIAQVRKPNSDDDISESDEDEVIETSKISNSDAFECFSKGLMWLEQQTDSDSTELMLLKQQRRSSSTKVADRIIKRDDFSPLQCTDDRIARSSPNIDGGKSFDGVEVCYRLCQCVLFYFTCNT